MHILTIPLKSDTFETWGLELPATNAARLAELLADNPRVVWRRARWRKDNVVLYRCGGADNGSYAVVDDDKATPTIDYYQRFTPIRLPQIGRAIEVRMWRSNLLTSLSITARNTAGASSAHPRRDCQQRGPLTERLSARLVQADGGRRRRGYDRRLLG